MAHSYRFTVPGLPVPKGRPRVGRTGTYTPARTKAHEKLIWSYALKAGVRCLTGAVTVWCEFHVPDPNKADADNLAKSVLDALNGTAYLDDRQVHELNVRKYRSDDPRTEVCIYPCQEASR